MKRTDDLKTRKQIVEVKDLKLEYEETYKIDPKTGEEIFDRDVEIENDIKLYDLYKKEKGLLTIAEIQNIRKKYGMNQKEFAVSIGVGEITVHRFENGSIQTDATDAIMRLSSDPDNMNDLLEKTRANFSAEIYQNFQQKINELRNLKKHCIAKYDSSEFKNLTIKQYDVNIIADALINKYNNQYDLLSKKYNIMESINSEYITPLKLQKLLYYVQSITLQIFGKPAFKNKIFAWTHGPVVEEIYQIYKKQGKTPINSKKNIKDIGIAFDKILDVVIKSYGQIEAVRLISLTHEEDPWKNTARGEEISLEKIKEYFNKVYEN